MKKFSLLTAIAVGFLAAPLQAGEETYKQVAPPPPELYGLGFYGAIDMGANIYQNRGGDQTFTDDNPNSTFFGSNLEVHPKNDVGFFGGVKLGYVFGSGWIRPTVEGDFFYNGFRGGADFTLNERSRPARTVPRSLQLAKPARQAGSIPARSWRTSFCDSHPETKDSSRMSALGSAVITPNLRVLRSGTL